ncbi:MAG TPA: hypothetical protein VE242_08935 [Chthoniobacterales bacterium]|nr:hypothetical protein [Chthoniobacterales bacterium]
MRKPATKARGLGAWLAVVISTSNSGAGWWWHELVSRSALGVRRLARPFPVMSAFSAITTIPGELSHPT